MLSYQHFYLVGIKGVAMASLAQCLVDAGKSVQGSDLAEEFVTQPLLDKLGVQIDIGFDAEVPGDIECLIYTAAHSAQKNPQVVSVMARGLVVISQAEAIAELFNAKKGIAVCGVGGKSTTSAMISWILEKSGRVPSFSVGVGNIPDLDKTGQWSTESEFFVAEADEYVIDPSAPSRGEEITPRFSFMQPFITVCTNLRFDHPDVYKDFAHTQKVFADFFGQIKEGGALVVNGDDAELMKVAQSSQKNVLSFGRAENANLHITDFQSREGTTHTTFTFQNQEYMLELQIPGEFNAMNACAAILASYLAGTSIDESVSALKEFRSTQRRSEFVGEKNGVRYYDDYAHHPNEVANIIHAYKEWFPNARLVVAFQSHTYSRTKALFVDFVQAFAEANEVVMIDIFASAREQFDPSMTSDLLCAAITEKFPQITAKNLKTIPNLANFCKTELQPGNIFLTLGAGDIYKVHELI